MRSARLLVMVLALCPLTAQAETLSGRIVGITDGNTLTLLDVSNQRYKIRLAGIDAPHRTQDFGEKSTSHLSAMAFNQYASAECRKLDRDPHEICVVFVNGKDVGLEQIRGGMAWWYQHYAEEQSPQERADYSQAEFMAKIHRYGLWNSKNPTPPWEWRKRKGLGE